MKNRAAIVLGLSCLLLAGVASAQQDMFCICLDPEDASTCCGSVDVPPFSSVDLYFCLRHPSGGLVSAWEARVECVTEATTFGDWMIVEDGLNVGSGDDYIVGHGDDPLFLHDDEAITLMTMSFVTISQYEPVSFYIRPIPDSETFADSPGYSPFESWEIPATTCSGEYDYPVLVINGGDPWVVDPSFSVSVTASKGEFLDDDNVAGTAAGAADGYDSGVDIPEPPLPPSDYLSFHFLHPEWDVATGPRFMSDYRARFDPDTSTKIWECGVVSDRSGTVELVFEPDTGFDPDWGLAIHDPDNGSTVSLDYLGYVYPVDVSAGVEKSLELWIGDEAVTELTPSSRAIPAGWSFVGLPLVPQSPGTLQEAILDEATGATFIYGHDDTGYHLMSSSDPAEQGKGLWVGTDSPFVWDMPYATHNDEVVTVPLDEGWNPVGYPLWVPTTLESVTVVKDGTESCDWEMASLVGWIGWGIVDYDSDSEAYVSSTAFETWRGYWVACYEPNVELVFDIDDIVMPAKAQVLHGFRAEDDWCLGLSVDERRDAAQIGCAADASDAFDALYDRPEPPAAPVATAVPTLRFTHPEWALPTGDAFVSDIRGTRKSPFSWEAELSAPEPGPVVLSWRRADLPADVDLQVYLPQQNRCVVSSMQDVGSATIEVGEDPVTVVFRSPDDATSVPDAAAVAGVSCHPNPFNPSTEIRLRTVAAGDVRLEIYDLRGRTVWSRGFGSQPAGAYTVTWHGRDTEGREVAGGTYFARLVLDGVSTGAPTKLTLVK